MKNLASVYYSFGKTLLEAEAISKLSPEEILTAMKRAQGHKESLAAREEAKKKGTDVVPLGSTLHKVTDLSPASDLSGREAVAPVTEPGGPTRRATHTTSFEVPGKELMPQGNEYIFTDDPSHFCSTPGCKNPASVVYFDKGKLAQAVASGAPVLKQGGKEVFVGTKVAGALGSGKMVKRGGVVAERPIVTSASHAEPPALRTAPGSVTDISFPQAETSIHTLDVAAAVQHAPGCIGGSCAAHLSPEAAKGAASTKHRRNLSFNTLMQDIGQTLRPFSPAAAERTTKEHEYSVRHHARAIGGVLRDAEGKPVVRKKGERAGQIVITNPQGQASITPKGGTGKPQKGTSARFSVAGDTSVNAAVTAALTGKRAMLGSNALGASDEDLTRAAEALGKRTQGTAGMVGGEAPDYGDQGEALAKILGRQGDELSSQSAKR